ncbi:receptor-like protein 33 [Eucalyptus grandis]|uniref:receptor-like protein 33 n=1 Tax=Eucalyptus grandis TaxID=71139 RepID=UPI00192EFBA3|nr:receptor-like protein 33 [Eucalyptus grandis]
MKVFSNTSLEVIDLSNNKFGGLIPLLSPVTVYYSIANNVLIGRIPSLICNATNLEMIDLSNNSLIGSLPWCLTNFSIGLSVLNLGMNHLEGTIPQTISLIDGLTTLDLSRNRFEGTLPRSLVNCTNLEILDLSINQMEDAFPTWLGKLPKLKVLILRSNNLKGPLNIPKGDLIFTKLRILDLSNNNFCGPLPANLIMNLEGMKNTEDGRHGPLYMTQDSFSSGVSYENSVTVMMKGKETKLVKILTIFTSIDLSHNFFQGDIPKVFGHLRYLIGLNLSHNHLTSSIPLTLGNLTNIGWLDLSSNMLSGRIPRALGDLTYLGYLNLSKNQLIGRIPQDKQLSTFSNDSFSGNPGLCGTPLPKACPGDAQLPPPSSSSTLDHKGHESWFKQKVAWIGYASGIVIGISIAYIAIETGWPKWLARGVRMLERSAVQWMEKPDRRAIKFHGW